MGAFDYEESEYREGRDGEERSMEDMGDNDMYIGEFKPKTFDIQGKGVMIFNDGSILQGWWQDNKPHGKGRNILANCTVKEGLFIDWEFTGPVEKKKPEPEKVDLPTGLDKNQLLGEVANEIAQDRAAHSRINDDLSSLKSDQDLPKIDENRLNKIINEVKIEADALPAMNENEYKEL